MRRLGILSACLVSVAVGCSSEEAEPKKTTPTCGINPWLECGAGETCWPVNESGRLECKNAPTDQIQDQPCELSVGTVTCAPHLYCLVSDPLSQNGICRAYCNEQSCPDGGDCLEVPVFDTQKTVLVCVPNADGGLGGSGGGDASTGGSSGASGSAGTSGGGTAGVSGGGTAGGASGSAGTGG